MSETATVQAVDGTTSVITDEIARSLALKLNLYVKVGCEPPVTNLKPTGCLSDVVAKIGWAEAEAKFPEVSAFLGRLRGLLEESSPGRSGPMVAVKRGSFSFRSRRRRGRASKLCGSGGRTVNLR